MEEVLKILESVKKASGSQKQRVLEDNKINILLRDVLAFVYNPFIVTGLSSKKINKKVNIDVDELGIPEVGWTVDIRKVFDYLKENHTGTDKDIAYIQLFIDWQPEEYKEMYKEIFTKDLKIGVTATTINKVWENLIPEYEVQQGHPLHKRIDKILNEEIILTQKLDGLRCSCRVENGIAELFSRQGQRYEGLVELESELTYLPNGMYDGELLLDSPEERIDGGLPKFLKMDNYRVPEKSILNRIYAPMPSKELFKATTSVVNSNLEEKKGVSIFLYDMTPLHNFDTMTTYEETAKVRKDRLSMLVSLNKSHMPHVKEVPVLYSGKFDNILIDAMLEQVLLCQQEGLMINLANSPYEFKRSNNLVKVKKMYPADLRIIGFEEGSGKNKGTLGAIIVNYKGFSVKVGSGFTDAERTYAWEHQEDLMGAIVTVQYFEETTNKKDNSLSLRAPVFKGFRTDKTEESYD